MTATGGVHSLLAEYAHPTGVRWTRNPEGAVDNERTNPSGQVAAERHYAEIPRGFVPEEKPGSSITLTLDRQTVLQSAPTLGEPHAAPDEGLQRATRESLAKNSGRWGAWE